MECCSENVTCILNAASGGDKQAAEDLIPLVYGELRKLAAWCLGQEAGLIPCWRPPWCIKPRPKSSKSSKPGDLAFILLDSVWAGA